MDQQIVYEGLKGLCEKYNATISLSYTKDTITLRIYAKHRVSLRVKTVEKILRYDDAAMALTTGYINKVIEEEF
jgi:hypothetical protein